MPKLLKDMRLKEISLVDEPASPGASIALFKRRSPEEIEAGENPYSLARAELAKTANEEALALFDAAIEKAAPDLKARSFKETMADAEARSEAYERTEEIDRFIFALAESIRSIFADASVKDPAVKAAKSVEEFVTAVKEKLSGNSETETDDVEKGKPCADCPDHAVCKKEGACKMAGENVAKSEIQKMIDEAVAKVKADADAAIAKAQEDAAKMVEKANKDAADAVAKINEERADEQRIVKARTMIGDLPGFTVEGVAAILKTGNKDAIEGIEKALAAAAELHKQAKTFDVLGASGGGIANTDINKRIDAATHAVLKEQPSISFAKAQTIALERDPKLYADYRAARN